MKSQRILALLAGFLIISLATCGKLSSQKNLRRQEYIRYAEEISDPIPIRERAVFYNVNQLPGQAIDIAVGADDSLWMVGTDLKINKWNPGLQKWEYKVGAGPRVSVGPDGNAWVLGTDNHIYAYTGNGWVYKYGAGFDIARGVRPQDAFVIGLDNAVWKWNGSSDWSRVTNMKGKKIACDEIGNPWIIDMQGKVLKYNNGQWEDKQMTGVDISIDQNNAVYVPKSDGTIYSSLDDGQNWSQIPDINGVNIAADSSLVYYVLDSTGKITSYQRI